MRFAGTLGCVAHQRGRNAVLFWLERWLDKSSPTSRPQSSFSGIIQAMWDVFTHVVSRILTFAWFIGAILMILTIPACILKIFSALWEGDDEEDQAVYEGVRKK